jgi:hypothetical protein
MVPGGVRLLGAGECMLGLAQTPLKERDLIGLRAIERMFVHRHRIFPFPGPNAHRSAPVIRASMCAVEMDWIAAKPPPRIDDISISRRRLLKASIWPTG